VPVLVMHGDDDQIVPYADSGPLSAKLLKNGTLKTYKGFPHGMPTTEAETINADLLAFIRTDAALCKTKKARSSSGPFVCFTETNLKTTTPSATPCHSPAYSGGRGIDMIDPRHRNEMMLPVGRTVLGELDLVAAFQVIDLADVLAVEIDHIHMFLNLRNVCHLISPLLCAC
jgi:hypothetical protein